ncbi:MAG: hypothetical protein A3H28_16165 [Acidobacteria bacterium RIFCSPLOWO2_02_FULL_61_28]|nr:MAG: hypothetical protein A3H28_16165 [Acidobacteria bacterium RIFCSPLOWO2_02_FULL_61_28]
MDVTQLLLELRDLKDRLSGFLADPRNQARARKSEKAALRMIQARELRNFIEDFCRAANPMWAESC